jgi:mono/diheme cytochrome c family protein
MRFRTLVAVIATTAVAACGKREFEPPDKAERIQQAHGMYSPQLFDSIAWESPEARSLEGNTVFAAKCRKCHGTLGLGQTDYATDRGLEVPSLVAPDWRLAQSIDSLRHRIFVGHEEGMPTWGVAGITVREIDGVAYYVLETLRPEVLGR